jgi:hypothetical protein
MTQKSRGSMVFDPRAKLKKKKETFKDKDLIARCQKSSG